MAEIALEVARLPMAVAAIEPVLMVCKHVCVTREPSTLY